MTDSTTPASRVARGGFGPRRSKQSLTASGLPRLNPRWTTQAAIALHKVLLEMVMEAAVGLTRTSKQQLIARALVSASFRNALVARAARQQPSRVGDLVRLIFQQCIDNQLPINLPLAIDEAQALTMVAPRAMHFRQTLVSHAGTVLPVANLYRSSLPPVLHRLGRIEWLRPLSQDCKRRKPPAAGARVLRILDELGLERLGELDPDSVICPERAYSRLRSWRAAKRGRAGLPPPMALLQSIVHTAYVPTALTSSGDHYWLVFWRRWATPAEVMNLFGVAGDAPTRAILSPSFRTLTAIQVTACMGRALHPGDAARVLGRLEQRCHLPPYLRYASSCSGIDLFAHAVWQSRPRDSWTYVTASEMRPRVADALAHIWGPYGLARSAVVLNAQDTAAIAASPYSDLWVCSPPCEPFSRRNHARSDDVSERAATALDAILAYPRAHSPLAIVLENVDEVDGTSVIDAAVMSLEGYEWESVVLSASDHGPMARVRRFWIGVRRQ